MAAATVLNSSGGGLLDTKSESVDFEDVIKECVETEASWGLMQNDLMFAVAVWSMVEGGFDPVLCREKPFKNQAVLPKNWKHETRQLYEAHFVLPPYLDYPVKLVALPADDILCINILVSNVSSKNIGLRSLAVHSSGYVPRPEEDTIRCKFSGLEDFHFLLKNEIIWPIRCSILTDQGIMNASLCGLSDEMKLRIVKWLSVREVLQLSLTCKDLHRICTDQTLWKMFFHKHFQSSCKCSTKGKECEETPDWLERYKETFFQKRKNSNGSKTSPSYSFHTVFEGPFGSEIDLEVE